MQEIFILITGLFSGIIGTILGLGGGVFTVPILVLIMNMNIHQAISLSLVAIVAKSIFSSTTNLSRNYINVSLGILLIFPAVIGSSIGGRVGGQSSELFISIFFAGILLLASCLVYFNRKTSPIHYTEGHFLSTKYEEKGKIISYTPVHYLWAMGTASVAGFLGAMVGGGVGSILVPIMRLINKVPIKAAASTSVFITGFSVMAPTFFYYKKGVLIPEHAIAIIIGSYFGAMLGTRILTHIKDKHISKFFSVTLILIAMLMLYKALIKP